MDSPLSPSKFMGVNGLQATLQAHLHSACLSHISQVGISEQVKTGREGMGLFEHMMEPQASPSFRKLHSTIVTTTLA